MELEETFGAMTFDIVPLSEDDQVDNLVGLWKASAEQLDEGREERLKAFAVECLHILEKALAKEDDDLMEEALPCFLVGSVVRENVQLYSGQKVESTFGAFISPTSMYERYTRYVEMDSDNGDGEISANTDNIDNLTSYHTWKALQLLYPTLSEDYFKNQNLSEIMPSPQVLACGILQISPTENENFDVSFAHRTFAQYFVAQLFADIMAGRYIFTEEELLHKFLYVIVREIFYVDCDGEDFVINRLSNYEVIRGALFSFKNPAIVNFVNANLNDRPFDSLSREVALLVVSFVEDSTFSPILIASIRHNHVNMCRLIKSLLCCAFDAQVSRRKEAIRELLHHAYYADFTNTYVFSLEEHYWSCFTYVCLAAEYSNVAMVEELGSIFEECLGLNLEDICDQIPKEIRTPLHFALKRGHYLLVAYFATRISLAERMLLYDAVKDTFECGPERVKALINCNRLLIGSCDSLLHENSKTYSKVIYAPHMHVELIKFFVQEGADIGVGAEGGKNLVTSHAAWLDEKEFCELCRFVIFDVHAVDLFMPHLPHWGDPLPEVMDKIDAKTLTQILEIPGVKLDTSTVDLLNVFKRGDLAIIELLVQHGVDIHQKDDKGQGVLHLAAEIGGVEVAKYLVSIGIPLDDPDNDGNTPLHIAVNNLAMVEYFVTENVNILATNNYGNNIAHLAAYIGQTGNLNEDLLSFLVSLQNPEIFKTQNVLKDTPVGILIGCENFCKIKNSQVLLNLAEAEGLTKKPQIDFLSAVQGGKNVEQLQLMMENGANAFEVNDRKQTALHLAAARGDLEVVKFLVLLGLPLECQDHLGNTPFLLSANVEIAKHLILQNADALVVDNQKNSIAHKLGGIHSFSAGPFKQEAYERLFTTANKAGRIPLHQWIHRGIPLYPDTISKIMTFPRFNFQAAVDEDGQTMFHTAVEKEYEISVLYCLLHYKFDQNTFDLLNHPDKWGNTPIHLAAKNCNWAVLKFLIANQANVLAKNRNGENILHIVIQQIGEQNREYKKVLLKSLRLPEGPTLLRMVDNKGRSPLHMWIKENKCLDFSFAKLLTKPGVDINQRDCEGNTMFLSAVEVGIWWLAKCLLNLGANHNAVNNAGNNALHVAITAIKSTKHLDGRKQLNGIKYLLSVGCDVLAKNNVGFSPLQLATLRRDDIEGFEELVSSLGKAMKIA